jgi:mono/diheme cytochrome c family protein
MRKLIPVSLAILAFCVLSASAADAYAQDAAAIERGQKVYVSAKCGICHAVEGKGAKKGPLDGVGSKLTADEIRAWIVTPTEMTAKTKATRKPPMKSYAHLPKEDVDGIVAYMVSLKKKS